MAYIQDTRVERRPSQPTDLTDDRVEHLAEVCKKRVMAMSAADHIRDRGGR